MALGAIAVTLCVIGLGLPIASFSQDVPDPLAAASIVAGLIALLITLVVGWPLFRPPAVPTEQGWVAYRHLQGARLYLRQQGKRSADSASDAEGVDVQEKLLPYAILFTLDNQWEKKLQAGYQAIGADPTWLSGGLTDLTNRWTSIRKSVQTSSAYIPPSSSSGGSSGGGGGFSGGGGGGGFSGGR